MAGLIIGAFVVGLLTSLGLAIVNEDVSKKLPIAQVLGGAWYGYSINPTNYWGIASAAVLAFIGWLVFLWYQKSVGR